MTTPTGGPDPLLVLADEMRDFGVRLAGAAEELRRRAGTIAPPAPYFPPMTPPPGMVWGPPPPPGSVPPGSMPWPPQGPPMPPPQGMPPGMPPGMAQGMPQGVPPQGWRPSPVPMPMAASGPKTSVWDRLGGRSLAWVGAGVTLLGAVLLLILAVQRGWLGPVPRLVVGGVFAVGLLGLAWRVHRTPEGRIGAFALAGTGVAVAYLDVVAATALYHFLPAVAGLLLGLGIAVGGLVLADRWDGQHLAVFAVLGAACCAPLCVQDANVLLVGFLLVLAGAAAPVQLRRGWPVLTLSAGLPPLLAALALDAVAVPPGSQPIAAGLSALVAAVVCAVLAGLAAVRSASDHTALVLLIAAPLPVMAVAPLLSVGAGGGLVAGVAGVLLAGWASGLVRPGWLPARFRLVAGGAGAVVLVQATVLVLPHGDAALGLLGEALVLAGIALRVRAKGVLLVSAIYTGLGWLVALGRPLNPGLLLVAPVLPPAAALLAAGLAGGLLLSVATVAVAVCLLRLGVPMPLRAWGWALLGLVGLYGSSGFVVCAAMLIAPDRAGFLTGHVLVTVLWAVGALVLLARGIDRQPLRIAGLVLVGAAVAKLVLFDLATLDGVTRVAAFLGAGIVLLTAGVRYARLIAAQKSAAEPAEAQPH